MRYKCIKKNDFDLWLTVGEIYDGEIVVSPKEFADGKYILLHRDDFKKPCYAEKSFFNEVYGDNLEIGVH